MESGQADWGSAARMRTATYPITLPELYSQRPPPALPGQRPSFACSPPNQINPSRYSPIILRFFVFVMTSSIPNSIFRRFSELRHTKRLRRPDSTVQTHQYLIACLREWVRSSFLLRLLRPKTRLSHRGYTNLWLKILLILRPVSYCPDAYPLMRNH